MRAHSLFSLTLALLGASCVLGTQTVKLHLPETRAAGCAVSSAPKVSFRVVDERRIREHCGTDVYGPYQARARFVSNRPVPDVIAEALDTRARELGFDVVSGGVPVTVSINEVMNRFWPDMTEMHSEGTVRVLARIEIAGRASYVRLVEGHAHLAEAAGFPEVAEQTLNASLSDAVNRLLCDPELIAAVTGSK